MILNHVHSTLTQTSKSLYDIFEEAPHSYLSAVLHHSLMALLQVSVVCEIWREPASTSLSPFRRSTIPSFASWVFQVCILASCLIFGCPGLNQSYQDSLHQCMIKHQSIGYSLHNTSLFIQSALQLRNQGCNTLHRL